MPVTCPRCGAVSHDLEFCDRCNADLAPPAAAPPPAACRLEGEPALHLSQQQRSHLTRPEAAVLVRGRRHPWRLHWIAGPQWPAWRERVEARAAARAAVLPPITVVEEHGGTWVIADATGKPAAPWTQPAASEPIAELRRLADFLDTVAGSLAAFRAAGWQWLTFDPNHLELAPDRHGLRLTNLDLQVTPLGRCPPQLRLNARYAAPEVCRFDAATLGPATDVFHLGLFAYYWLAKLLPGGFLGRGLEAFGHRLPPLRTYCPQLPPGIAPVLARATATELRLRHADPAALAADLRRAIDRTEQRSRSTAPVRWELAGHTRTGRAKDALGRANEDAIVTRSFTAPHRAVVAVADGITTCDIGNGALASRLAAIALEATVDERTTADSFRRHLQTACRRASENLLAWALEQGHRDKLLRGGDLMGTTLTVGWLEGRRLQVGNLGDSRVYLLAEDYLEQLTVDGDLGASLLAAGAPPEHVQELGSAARALRECVGGCAVTAEGQLAVVEEHARPTWGDWPLLPGDLLVFCTDGLVEEGVYLDPADLEELLRRHGTLPADRLAALLAEAADTRQRVPSAVETEGMGDNISCVVVKIAAAGP